MDKYFPLKLYIFSYETELIEFQSIMEAYNNQAIEQIKEENIIEISKENEELFIKDNIIIEQNSVETYLKLIISGINEMNNIFDKSQSNISKQCFNIATTEIKNKIIEFSKKTNIDQIDEILPELYFINKIKIETEIESGLLFCEKCNRWFPIIETIPQMLPDEYRDEEKEIQFLQTNKNLMDDEFFKQDLKPFNL